MTSTETGRKAEAAARVYLEMRGFKVLEQNWRRPEAEVDIIAHKNGTIHFIEVRYRRSEEQGGGLESITPAKLRRMRRGAEAWVHETKYRGEFVLSAVELGGPGFAVLGFIENIF